MPEPDQLIDLARVQAFLHQFAADRDWEQFHTPKNLAMALSVEVAELVEIFQWLTPEESEPNGFSAERLTAKLAMLGLTCWICGEPIPDEPGQLHLDHVKPLNAGGAHTPANLRPSCASCNISKSDEWPFDTSTAHLRFDPARLP